MNSGKYVFRQMLDFVNQYEFNKCEKHYSGNYRVRDLLTMTQVNQNVKELQYNLFDNMF